MELTQVTLIPTQILLPIQPQKKMPWRTGTMELDIARENILQAMKDRKLGYSQVASRAGIDSGGLWHFLWPSEGKGKNTSYELVMRTKRALEIV